MCERYSGPTIKCTPLFPLRRCAGSGRKSSRFSKAFALGPKNIGVPNFIKIAISRLNTKLYGQISNGRTDR